MCPQQLEAGDVPNRVRVTHSLQKQVPVHTYQFRFQRTEGTVPENDHT